MAKLRYSNVILFPSAVFAWVGSKVMGAAWILSYKEKTLDYLLPVWKDEFNPVFLLSKTHPYRGALFDRIKPGSGYTLYVPLPHEPEDGEAFWF